VDLRFAASAFRHGITEDRARYVVEHCACPLYPPDRREDEFVAFFGPDGNGVPLEVFGIELDDGSVLVIHAMNLRNRYLDDYARVMECQNG
jgi:hypothetical protein